MGNRTRTKRKDSENQIEEVNPFGEGWHKVSKYDIDPTEEGWNTTPFVSTVKNSTIDNGLRNIIPVLEDMSAQSSYGVSGMGTDSRYQPIELSKDASYRKGYENYLGEMSAQADRSANARKQYQDNQTNTNVVDLDWGNMTNDERANAVAVQEYLNTMGFNQTTPTEVVSPKEKVSTMSDAEKYSMAEQLSNKEDKFTKEEEEYAKALSDYYEKTQRNEDLVNGGTEGYQRAMMMQRLGGRASDRYTFFGNMMKALPNGDKLMEKINPEEYANIEQATDQNKVAGTLGYLASKVGQYATLGELMGTIPALQAAKAGISGGVGGGLNALGEDLAMNTSGALANGGLKLASGIGDKVGAAVGGIALDQLADTVLDVAPRTISKAQEGASAGEIAKEFAKTEAENLGYNLLGQGASELFGALGKGKRVGSDAVAEAQKRLNEIGIERGTASAMENTDVVKALDEEANTLKEIIRRGTPETGAYDDLAKTLNGENAIKTNAEIEAEALAEQTAKEQKRIEGYLIRLKNGTATKNDMDTIMKDESLRNAVNESFGTNLKGIPSEDATELRRIKRGVYTSPFVENTDIASDIGFQELEEPVTDFSRLSEWQGPFQKQSTAVDDLLKQTEGSEVPGFTEKELADARAKTPSLQPSFAETDDYLSRVNTDNPVEVAKPSAKELVDKRLSTISDEWAEAFNSGDYKKADELEKEMQNLLRQSELIDKVGNATKKKEYGTANSIRTMSDTPADGITSLYKRVNSDATEGELSLLSDRITKELASGDTSNAEKFLNDVINDAGTSVEDSIEAKKLLSQIQGGTSASPKLTSTTNTTNSPDVGYSKVYTNTLTKQRAVDMNTRADQIDAMYNIHHKDDVIKTATDRVANDYDTWDKHFRNPTTTIESDADVVSAMQIVTDKQSQIDDLIKNGGSQAEIDRLVAEKRIIQLKLREGGTEKGQFIKAYDYWNGTPEGAILNTQRLMDSETKKWVKGNKGLSEKIDTVCEKVNRDSSVEQIEAEIKKILGKKSVQLSDEDINYIANLYKTGATGKEISKMVKFRMANGVWDVPEETVATVTELLNKANQYGVNSKARVELETQALWELANCSGKNSSIVDKLNAWRYLAMLGNPKTHVRNMVGNALFQGVTGISNTIAALMEAGVDKTSKALGGNGINRTKAILTTNDSALIKACSNDAYEGSYRALSGGSKYNENLKGSIKNYKEAFDSRGMRKLNGTNSNWLDNEDFTAMKFKYKTSLAGYLKSNGIDESVFDAEKQLDDLRKISETRLLTKSEEKLASELSEQVELLNKGRSYAVKQANYSAFHEDNAFADWLTKTSKDAPGVVKYMIEGVLPFKKTPANILKSGLEYSPLNIINDIYRGVQLKNGNIDASEFIEGLSKTFTGTSMVGLGAYLYNKGILRSSDEDTKWQDNLEGIQNYSLLIGGKTYTIDFAAPSVMPLLLGAEIRKVFNSNNVGDEEAEKSFWEYLSNGLQAVSRLGSPIMETSMLSGVNDTLEAISQGDVLDALGTLGMTTLTGYATQMIPTLMGQVERVIDNTRRSTYSGEQNALARTLDKKLTKVENKTPLSFLNEPYTDVYARQQTNNPVETGNKALDTLINAVYQGFSPTYIDDVNTTDVDKELRRLYEENGKDSSVFFDLETSPKIDGKRLSEKDYTTYTTEKGTPILSDLREMFASEEYKNLTDQQKLQMVKDYESVIKNKGKESISEDFDMSEKDKYNAAYKSGGIKSLVSELSEKYQKKKEKEEKELAEEQTVQGQTVVDNQEQTNNQESVPVLTSDFLSDNDIKKNSKAATVYAETGSEEQTLAYKEVSKVSTNKDSIAVLENSKYDNMTDYDKGYVLSQSMSTKAKKAQEFVNNGNYEDFYIYYLVKAGVDTSGNGKIDKSNGEKDNLIPYLRSLGFSEDDVQEIQGWF